MKILLTGGGTGGHFYPLIAVAQELNKIAKEKKLLQPQLYYMSNNSYDAKMLFENGISFKKVSAGKIRRYFSFLNIIDLFKTLWGSAQAFWYVFVLYPDVVFSKGGFSSFPVLLAARVFRIPVIIHESDSIPGKVNLWASKFARRIAIGFSEAIKYLPKEKVAHTGNPIRKSFLIPLVEDSFKNLRLEKNIPIILVMGGSQGAQKINEILVDALPKLVNDYQIVHQTGNKNFKAVQSLVKVVLGENKNKERYRAVNYIDTLNMRMLAGVSDLIITRAGAGAISEIAVWGIPSIVIPLANSASNHQRRNAFNYARSGAAIVIEEKNLNQNLLVSEIDKLMENSDKRIKMSEAAKKFAKPEAARKVAEEIISIALEHEE